MMEEEIQQAVAVYDLLTEFLVNYSFQLLGALVVLFFGIYIARKISSLILSLLVKKGIDVTLSRFVASGIKLLIITMVAIIALGKIGVSVTPFVAAIGALSLGAGLALQGLLSNYGAGVSIIVTRPFVVGDTISVHGVSGIVKEVHLAYTVLDNEDEVEITIPNKHIVGEIIHNSHADSVIELSIGIAYHCDPSVAINVILNSLKTIDGMSTQREPQVGIDCFGNSSIDIGIRFWAKTEILFQTKYQANSAVFKALTDNNIEIPFPQRHVHIYNEDA